MAVARGFCRAETHQWAVSSAVGIQRGKSRVVTGRIATITIQRIWRSLSIPSRVSMGRRAGTKIRPIVGRILTPAGMGMAVLISTRRIIAGCFPITCPDRPPRGEPFLRLAVVVLDLLVSPPLSCTN